VRSATNSAPACDAARSLLFAALLRRESRVVLVMESIADPAAERGTENQADRSTGHRTDRGAAAKTDRLVLRCTFRLVRAMSLTGEGRCRERAANQQDDEFAVHDLLLEHE
jgi:hypothetical protein